jgi:hypothetical protein
LRRSSRIAAAFFAFAHAAAPVGIALAPRAAAAQSANDVYKQHMRNGVKLYEDKNYTAAIAEFDAAYKAEPKASPLVNTALCQKGLFNYPKAILALETALSKHGQTMDADDKRAAEEAIAEMKGLLAYVLVRLSPPEATLVVDGEDQARGAAQKPVPLGPGSHRIGAYASGYARAEETVTVASGEKGKVVVLRLVADKGWVTIKGHDAKTALFVDGKQVGVGQWGDLVSPGNHVIGMTRQGTPDYVVDLVVVAGRSHEIRPGFGGTAHAGPAPVLTPAVIEVPPPPKKVEPQDPPMRGLFALATASLLFPTAHPKDFPSGPPNSGAAAGIRAGYRVNTPASFDLMFEYGNVSADKEISGGELEYSLSTARFGLNLRLMTPGKSLRMVGTIGGGFVYGDLSEFEDVGGYTRCGGGCAGIDGFLIGELGAELDFGGVLVGLSAQSYFQSTKGLKTDDYRPFDNDPLVFLGGGLRIGYGTW